MDCYGDLIKAGKRPLYCEQKRKEEKRVKVMSGLEEKGGGARRGLWGMKREKRKGEEEEGPVV